MLDVIIALVPAMIAAFIYFKIRALVFVGVCIGTCVVSEWLCNLVRKKPNSLDDLSAVVTGIILAFSVPPALPWWAAVIGSAFAVIVGKMVFGGLGANIFNPAMVGRAFLTACFGMLMTTWTVPATIDPQMPKIAATGTIAVTQATPLAWSKLAIKGKADTKIVTTQLEGTLTGEVGGCLGETSTVALLVGALYLVLRRTINVNIPLAVLSSAFVIATFCHLVNPNAYMPPWLHLTTGGMLLGAFFIATDPVTAPLSTKGMWIFGIGVGALVMLIRIVGEYPEGVMYAVLIMNAVTPLIDRFCKLTPAGGLPNA
jgi:electron transport complex protein RnfD